MTSGTDAALAEAVSSGGVLGAVAEVWSDRGVSFGRGGRVGCRSEFGTRLDVLPGLDDQDRHGCRHDAADRTWPAGSR